MPTREQISYVMKLNRYTVWGFLDTANTEKQMTSFYVNDSL